MHAALQHAELNVQAHEDILRGSCLCRNAALPANAAQPARHHEILFLCDVVLMGDGPDRTALEKIFQRSSRVTLLPYELDRARVAQVMAAADFYLACGPGETFGLAIAEALAAGLPVLAVNRGAAPDRVAGSKCAELYEHGSAASCAEAMMRLLPRLGPELCARARLHALRSFDWARTFDRLMDLYTELVRTPA